MRHGHLCNLSTLFATVRTEPLVVGVVLIHTYGVPMRDTFKCLELSAAITIYAITKRDTLKCLELSAAPRFGPPFFCPSVVLVP